MTISFYAFSGKDNSAIISLINAEALSMGEMQERLVSDITNNYDEEIVQEPDSINEQGMVVSYKDVVTSVKHTVVCSMTDGRLRCMPRTDYHYNSSDWFLCPNDH